jgi:hypothetical protein
MVLNVGEIIATTLKHYSPSLADNITNHNALFMHLKDRGNMRPFTGRQIAEGLMYAENSTVKWYSGLGLLDVSASDTIDEAQFDIKQLNANVVMSGLDDIKNSGKEAIHNLAKNRIQVMEITLQNTLSAGLYSNGTGSDGQEIGGLQLLVADDPTTGTVGGIPRASNTFWRNQTFDFSAESSAGAGSAANIKDAMNTLWLRTLRMSDHPDVIMADSNYYNFYLSSLQEIQRITNATKAKAGFESIAYKNAVVYYDENCPTNHMYFLNTKYLKLRPAKGRNFVLGKAKTPTLQDAEIFPMFWAGNMTLCNASLQGVIKE